MRFRLKAFGLHLLGSACALSLVLGGLYFGWYRWPGWYLTGVLHVLLIVCGRRSRARADADVDHRQPHKPRRELARDIAMIVAVQLVALTYGAATLWHGRPLYYTFSADRLEMVQASDIDARRRSRLRAARIRASRRTGTACHAGSGRHCRMIPTRPRRSCSQALFGRARTSSTCRATSSRGMHGLPHLREQLTAGRATSSISRKPEQAVLQDTHDHARPQPRGAQCADDVGWHGASPASRSSIPQTLRIRRDP